MAWTSVTRNVNFTTKVDFVEIRIMNLVGFFLFIKVYSIGEEKIF